MKQDTTSLETVETLSVKINTSENTIRKWSRKKLIPSYTFGRKLMFDLNEVIASIKKHKAY